MTATLPERPLCILHIPVDLGGHAKALANAQRALGHHAISANLEWSSLGFNGDECHDMPLGTPGRFRKRELARLRLLCQSIVSYDVIHCHFGQSLASVRPWPREDSGKHGMLEWLVSRYSRLVWLRDITLWRRLGKRVAMTLYGDDVRLVDETLRRNAWSHLGLPEIGDRLVGRDGYKRAMVAQLERQHVALFATNPDLLAFLPQDAQFLPYGHVDPAAHCFMPPATGRPLRLVHLPTNRDVKGTSFFVEAVAQARASGLEFDFTLIENMPNNDALKVIAEADILLDQLRVGWYGGVAVEAMAMGKPVVAYLNPADRMLSPPALRAALPIIEASPETISAVLIRTLQEPCAQLAQRGVDARAYCTAWHDPLKVAGQVLAGYRRGVGQE